MRETEEQVATVTIKSNKRRKIEGQSAIHEAHEDILPKMSFWNQTDMND